ncbi:MAG: gamma-glutamylcyclotransferase family protein [Nitrososphaerota archaeon]
MAESTTKRINYFAYDVLLNPDQMRLVIKSWHKCFPAWLPNYRLVFDSYSVSWRGGVAGLKEDEGTTVYGVVYVIDEQQLYVIDRFEGLANLRMRIKVTVKSDYGEHNAYTHVSSNPRGHVPPTKQYLSLMTKGLRQVGYGDKVIMNIINEAAKR